LVDCMGWFVLEVYAYTPGFFFAKPRLGMLVKSFDKMTIEKHIDHL
jgi:hypothetical protein